MRGGGTASASVPQVWAQHRKCSPGPRGREPRPLQTCEVGGGWWGWPTPGPGRRLSPCDCRSGSGLACGPVSVALGHRPRLVPTAPPPPACSSPRSVLPASALPGGCVHTEGDRGRGGGTRGAWGSHYWLNVDQSAGRQVVAAGRVGSPFSHKALATGSTSTANGAGAGAPLLHLPSPPPTLCRAAWSPASRPGPAPTHTRPPLTTGKLPGFRLGAACSSALSSDVTSSRNPARTPTSSEPRRPRRPTARALCVSPRWIVAEPFPPLSVPITSQPHEQACEHRSGQTTQKRSGAGRCGKPQTPLQRPAPPGTRLAEAPGPARWHSRMGCVGEDWEGVRPQNLPRWRRPRARGPLLIPTSLAS